MTDPLLAKALEHLLSVHSATLVVAYGSLAAGTADSASDIDLVAFAPVEKPLHDGTTIDRHDLDAWIYPNGHPFEDPELARVHPAFCLHDPDQRFSEFQAAVEASRAAALRPLDGQAKADLAAWTRKMMTRICTETPEGWHRYHWLVSEGPELWCRFRDRPWEGPKKALARMRAEEPSCAKGYEALLTLAPHPQALELWLNTIVPSR